MSGFHKFQRNINTHEPSVSDLAGDGNEQGGYDRSSQMESPTKTKKGGQSMQTLLPVTIRMLLNTGSDEESKIDGQELGLITFIGRISSVEAQPTNVNYIIHDGTGLISVKMWVDSEENAYIKQKQAEWTSGTYVRVYGHLRKWQKKASVVSFRLQKIEDFNELTCHFLEVIAAHLHNTRKMDTQASYASSSNYTSNNNNFINQPNMDMDFSDVQTAVLSVVKPYADGPNSITTEEIMDALQNYHYSEDAIRSAITFLLEEGHLYVTLSDNHFKPTV